MSDRLIVSLCTYNEKENLPLLIEEIQKVLPDAHLLIVDDSSPDGTGEIADEFAKKDSKIRVLHRPVKEGLGKATIAAFEYVCELDYDFMINMDADFSHQPKYLSELEKGMETADVTIGSRYIEGGGVEGWGFKRYAMSWGVNFYARLLLGLPSRDNSGSFRCYRIAHLSQLDFGKFRSHGYAIQEEILYRLRRVGSKFKEIPIVFEDRFRGQSKIRKIDAIEAIWIIFRLGIDRLFGVSVTKNIDSKDSNSLKSD